MNKIKVFFDFGNMILSLMAAIFSLIIVMRTEKGLKRCFELFFISLAVLFLASVIELNKYVEMISSMQAKSVLIVSRFIALIFTASALLVMVKIVRKELRCETPEIK